MSIIPAALPRNDTAAATKALLQLSASRGRLAIELANPFVIGPLTITKLITSLEGLRFPVDLSGGVGRFRHRRGSLDVLEVESNLATLATFLTPFARIALDNHHLRLALLPAEQGLTVGLHDESFALAFRSTFAPDDDVIRFVISNARGAGLRTHPHAAAMRVARAFFGRHCESRGSLISLHRALPRLAREALLDAGARLPSCERLRIAWGETEDGIRLVASAGASSSQPPSVVHAIELARIAEQADDALVRDDLEQARAAYLVALESAPRHPDLVLRVAEIDAIAANNPESTLAALVETMPAVDGGLVAAELLSAIGDREAASVAARRAAEAEPYPPLAARILVACASFTNEQHARLAILDDAVARSPSSAHVRWSRARARLACGHFDDASADFGQLEAAARGAHAKFDVCLEAGRLLMDNRQPADARRFFERGLRYMPRSLQATVGLARAFLSSGDARRGVALLSRAVSLSGAAESTEPDVVIELAVALAEHVNDLPAAIYHARSVPFGTAHTVAARALEARWRAQLGDIVGASHAFALAREATSHLAPDTIAKSASWLLEAARFELDVREDPRAAQRHAEIALRARPHDPAIEALFRAAATAVARGQHTQGQHPQAEPTKPAPLAPASPPPTPAPSDHDQELDESDIDRLTDQIRANPNDTESVRRLCQLLERANRLLDLVALVSARLEETTDPELRTELTATYRRTLIALIDDCRANARTDEAEMYEMVLGGLD